MSAASHKPNAMHGLLLLKQQQDYISGVEYCTGQQPYWSRCSIAPLRAHHWSTCMHLTDMSTDKRWCCMLRCTVSCCALRVLCAVVISCLGLHWVNDVPVSITISASNLSPTLLACAGQQTTSSNYMHATGHRACGVQQQSSSAIQLASKQQLLCTW